MKDWDVSYPRESAERRLLVTPGTLTLDQLAELMSLHNTEEPVSVRDTATRPVTHSKVYLRGAEQPWEPYFVHALGRKPK